MNLTDLLIDVSAGFVSGAAYGYSGISPVLRKEIREDKLDVLEAELDEKEMEKFGVDEYRIGVLKSANSKLRRFVPILASYPVAFAETLARGGSWSTHLFPFMGGALVGEAVGRAIRRARNGLNKNDLTALKDISSHPENARKYLTSEMMRDLEFSLAEVEKAGANGQNLGDPSLRRIYDSINSGKKIYTPALIKWSLSEIEKSFNLGLLQANAKDFFENSPQRSVAFIGDKQGTTFNLYELADHGRILRISVADFSKVPVLTGGADSIQHVANNLSINYRESTSWNKDYITFSRQLSAANRNRGFMLLKGVPEDLKNNMVAMAYLKSMEGDQGGSG